MRRSAWFRHTDRGVTIESLPEAAEPFAEYDDTLTRAIMALKPRLKEAVLCWYQQLSADEAAEALGVSRSAVYRRPEQARKLLREELEAGYDEVR